MCTRQWAGLILSALTVLVLGLGLANPGATVVALPVSGGLILLTWLVSRVPVPIPLIVAWGVSAVLAGVTVMAAAVLALTSPTGVDDDFPWWLWGLTTANAVTTVGGVWYVARHIAAVRRARSGSS